MDKTKEKYIAPGTMKKIEIGLPVSALAFVFSPVILFFLATLHAIFLRLFLISILAPIVGIVLGIVSLCMGEKRIGKLGVILANIAIWLPIAFVIIVTILFETGAIVIGM